MKRLWLCFFIFFIAACSTDTAQGVTDIGNSVAGLVLDVHGKPLANARVLVYMDSWKDTSVTDSIETRTNEKGEFLLKGISKSEPYILFAEKDSFSILSQSSDTLKLARHKRIFSRIRDKSSGWVRIVGQSQKTLLAKDGSFELSEVPSGDLTLVYGDSIAESRLSFKTTDTRDSLQLPDLIQAKSVESWLEITDSRYYQDSAFEGIQIDLEELPPEIASNNTEILRLTYPLQDFALSQDFENFVLPLPIKNKSFELLDGLDSFEFQILNADKNPIDFEVDYWDADLKKALLWVRLDSIRSKDSVLVFSFNKQKALQNSPFREKDGVMAVLHLNDEDLVVHQGKAIRADSGFIGKGLSLAESQYLDLGLLDPCEGDFTLSLWVYWYGKNDQHQILFSQRSFWSDSTSRFQWHFDNINDVFAVYNHNDQRNKLNDLNLPLMEWAYLNLVFEDGFISVYLNGEIQGESSPFAPAILSETVPLRIGGNEVDTETWNGVLDEIRIESVARNQEWIRLSYETQKAVKN